MTLDRSSVKPGVYDDPIFVSAPETSLTIMDLPPVRHYFTVSFLTRIVPQGAATTPLVEPATTGGMPDTYATSTGVKFSTVPETGVLANDGVLIRLKARLVSASVPNPTTVGSLQVFKDDGSFIFAPVSTFVGTATFQYQMSDDGGATYPYTNTVSIIIAQESGQAQEASGTTDPALRTWTIQQDSTQNAPANWSGALNPILSQYSGIGLQGDSSLGRYGTYLFMTSGLPQGRTDYRSRSL